MQAAQDEHEPGYALGGFVFATLAVPFAKRGETPIDNALPNTERLLHESVTIALRLILVIPGLAYLKLNNRRVRSPAVLVAKRLTPV